MLGIYLPINPPTLDREIDNQTVTEDTTFSFTIPENTFKDVDAGDELTYQESIPLE